MNIAIYHNLPPGGAKRALFEFCRLLHQRGHQLDLYAPATAAEHFLPLAPFLRQQEITPLDARTRSRQPFIKACHNVILLQELIAAQRIMAEKINNGGYDVVFVHHCQITQAPSILKYLRPPRVYMCQEPMRFVYEAICKSRKKYLSGQLLSRIDARNIKAADLIIANSYYSRESILRCYGLDSYVNYLGVDTGRFKHLGKRKGNYILSVGRLDRTKGHRFLITAMNRIEAAARPELMIIGNGNREEEQLLRMLAIANEVRLRVMHQVSEKQLVDLYNRALLVACAPYLEPFGLVTLEAMACGTPVVAVREGGLRETCINGSTGLLTHRDADEFGTALKKMLDDGELRQRMGNNGIRVAHGWSWEKATDSLVRLLRKATVSELGP